MLKITALAATIAFGLTGCHAQGFSAATASAKTRFPDMLQCAKEAASAPSSGAAKHETFMCEEKFLGFTGEQQEYVGGQPIACAEPSSDGI